MNLKEDSRLSLEKSLKFFRDYQMDSHQSFVQIRNSNNEYREGSVNTIEEERHNFQMRLNSLKARINSKYSDTEPKIFDEFHYPKQRSLIKSRKVLNNIIVAKDPHHVSSKVDLFESHMEKAMKLTQNTLPDPAPSLYKFNKTSYGLLTKSNSRKSVTKN